MNITIRLAAPGDALEMAQIIMCSWENAYNGILPVEYIREKNSTRLEQYKRVIKNDNINTYVIQHDNNIIGIMKIDIPQDDDLDESFYELHYIYLHPNYFRQGIGTRAVEFICEEALKLGKKIFSVWVLAENINAIEFYKKCGFTADNKITVQNRGGLVTSIRMRKILS